MITFTIKLAVAVLPLLTVIIAVILLHPPFRRRMYISCIRRPVRSAVLRAVNMDTRSR